ncbi:ABC transporter permease [Nissabacter sp. SGAir0207]|uniref:ABC transporter permease n=1 Tax=Nissabacter sp. SGAir0207 TaxID=2126321 RepID=UPI0026CCCEF4
MAGPGMRRGVNPVLLLLLALMVLALGGLGLVSHAPNRLVSGRAIGLLALPQGGGALLGLPLAGLLVLALLPPARWRALLTLLLAEGLLYGLTAVAGTAATLLAGDGDGIARTSLGGGYWAAAALCVLAGADAVSRLTTHRGWRLLLNAQMALPVVALLASGQLNALSLLQEYDNRADVFHEALWQHLGLLAGTLVPALLIGLPLGVLCARSVRWRGPLFPLLNIIQTIPSIALFGLLLAPLAGLAAAFPWLARAGISGIGRAPAIIALVLYALLPLVRSVVAGLQAVPPQVLESARGMGMTRGQLLRRVELPLALPVILAGVRVVAVQTVGMAMVAALIGAGGFGAIMFQGLLSSALDLVLLGVIPVVLLAVVIDGLFTLLVSVLEPSRR